MYWLEVKRFTKNARHHGAVGSIHDTVFLHFLFGLIPFIRSFLVPLRQKEEEKKAKKN